MAYSLLDPRRPAWLAAAILLTATPTAALLATHAHGGVPAATEGADSILGGPTDETLMGLGGPDSIRGMEGADDINGNAGDDSLGGGPGNDLVHGGRGSDQINGGQGDDTLAGDRDGDTLTGGLGADRFIFDNNSGDDLITDFDSAGGDRIELPTGFPYTVADTPMGMVITLTGYGELRLAGVTIAKAGTWLAPVAAPAPNPSLAPVASPPKPPARWLLGLIVVLALAFVGLLSMGLVQLVRGGRRDKADG